MIEAISAVLSQAPGSQQTPAEQPVQALEAPAQQPSSVAIADFTKAISTSEPVTSNPATSDPAVPRDAQPSATPPSFEIEAAVPAKETGLTRRMSREATSFFDHLNNLTSDWARPEATQSQPGDTPGDGKSVSSANKESMDDSMARLERAFTSTTEAALVSTSSTQASNVFNTLLKGQ